MRDYDVGIVPVLDARGRPVGVVTDRDLTLRVLAEQLPPLTPLSRVMSPKVITCRVDEALEVAEERLAQTQRSRIVVVNRDGAVVGVISLSDISQVEPAERAGSLLNRIARREALEHTASV